MPSLGVRVFTPIEFEKKLVLTFGVRRTKNEQDKVLSLLFALLRCWK